MSRMVDFPVSGSSLWRIKALPSEISVVKQYPNISKISCLISFGLFEFSTTKSKNSVNFGQIASALYFNSKIFSWNGYWVKYLKKKLIDNQKLFDRTYFEALKTELPYFFLATSSAVKTPSTRAFTE